MNSTTFAAIDARLYLPSKDASRHQGTITTYAEVSNHLQSRYATDAVIAKVDETINNYTQALLTREGSAESYGT